MHYANATPFSGNTAKAFDLAVAALTPLGFQIAARDQATLDLTGPGMNSTRQSSILGASRIQIARVQNELAADAELGGVQRITRFVTLFPIALILLLGLVFVVVFGLTMNNQNWVLPVAVVVAGNGLLWLILGPVLARYIKNRTCRGIDALLHNMAVAGESAYPRRLKKARQEPRPPADCALANRHEVCLVALRQHCPRLLKLLNGLADPLLQFPILDMGHDSAEPVGRCLAAEHVEQLFGEARSRFDVVHQGSHGAGRLFAAFSGRGVDSLFALQFLEIGCGLTQLRHHLVLSDDVASDPSASQRHTDLVPVIRRSMLLRPEAIVDHCRRLRASKVHEPQPGIRILGVFGYK
jgi:hypothetical protein